MKSKPLLGLFLCLAAGSSGCGDNAVLVMRDAITTSNEVADWLDKIPADQSADATEGLAKTIADTHFKAFKAKWEAVKKRLDGFSKYDKDEKLILWAAVQYHAKEALDTEARVARSVKRVEQIRGKLGRESDFPKLTECISFPPSVKGHREAAKQVLTEEFFKKNKDLEAALTPEARKFLELKSVK